MESAPLAQRVVFVGAGPRVIALVDRIGAYARSAGTPPLTLTLVDPYPAGAGKVWTTDQSRSLLNNTSASDTTVFCDETIRSAAPIEGGPSLHQWCSTVGIRHPDASVRTEATRMQPWSKPPRALQGEYYRWALREVAGRHSSAVRVEERRARVDRVSLSPRPTVLLEDGTTLDADGIVLSMGFVDDALADEEREWRRFACRQGLVYRAPAMMDATALDDVDLGEPLLVRGLGATFFDLLGLIEESSAGRPRQLSVGSATGLPKRAQPDGPGPEVTIRGLTPAVLSSWLDSHAGRQTADAQGLWTMLHDDLARAFESHAGRLPPAVPGAERFEWSAVAAPGWNGIDPFDRTLDAFFAQESVTIDRPARSPWAAVRQAVLELRPRVLALIQSGALPPQGADELQARFLRPASRLTSGPPAERQRLLRSWRDDGRVRFIGDRARFGTSGTAFVATSRARPGEQFAAGQLLEARQAFGSATASSSSVVRGLVQDGFAEAARGMTAADDGIRVDPHDHRLVVADGTPRTACWVAGHLARSTQRGVNQGAIPRSGDPFLQEADVIAASVVAALRVASEAPATG